MLEQVFGETCGPTCQCWNRNVIHNLDGVNIRNYRDCEGLDEHGWLDEEWHKQYITDPCECQYYCNAIHKLWMALFENTGLKRECMGWRGRAKRRQQSSADFYAKLKTEWVKEKIYYARVPASDFKGEKLTHSGIEFVHFPGRLLTMMKAHR